MKRKNYLLSSIRPIENLKKKESEKHKNEPVTLFIVIFFKKKLKNIVV